MKTDTAAEYLIRKLDEQRETVKSEVIRQPLTHDEYARLRGVVQGLDFARELIKDLAKEIETSDE
jgi:endonuclease YncB( thermonuclease family)